MSLGLLDSQLSLGSSDSQLSLGSSDSQLSLGSPDSQSTPPSVPSSKDWSDPSVSLAQLGLVGFRFRCRVTGPFLNSKKFLVLSSCLGLLEVPQP